MLTYARVFVGDDSGAAVLEVRWCAINRQVERVRYHEVQVSRRVLPQGTSYTCFTSTQVQTLTPEAEHARWRQPLLPLKPAFALKISGTKVLQLVQWHETVPASNGMPAQGVR